MYERVSVGLGVAGAAASLFGAFVAILAWRVSGSKWVKITASIALFFVLVLTAALYLVYQLMLSNCGEGAGKRYFSEVSKDYRLALSRVLYDLDVEIYWTAASANELAVAVERFTQVFERDVKMGERVFVGVLTSPRLGESFKQLRSISSDVKKQIIEPLKESGKLPPNEFEMLREKIATSLREVIDRLLFDETNKD